MLRHGLITLAAFGLLAVLVPSADAAALPEPAVAETAAYEPAVFAPQDKKQRKAQRKQNRRQAKSRARLRGRAFCLLLRARLFA